MNAYEELAAAGWIAGRIGSGTRVAGGTPRPRRLETHRLLAAAHYPATSALFYDLEGNRLHLQG